MNRTSDELAELAKILESECRDVKSLSFQVVKHREHPFLVFICDKHFASNKPTSGQISFLKGVARYKSETNIWQSNKWAVAMAINMIQRHGIDREQVYFRVS